MILIYLMINNNKLDKAESDLSNTESHLNTNTTLFLSLTLRPTLSIEEVTLLYRQTRQCLLLDSAKSTKRALEIKQLNILRIS